MVELHKLCPPVRAVLRRAVLPRR